MQAQQPLLSYWTQHKGDYIVNTTTTLRGNYRNKMCPTNDVLKHPAAELLQEYATFGCPARTGRHWLKEEMWEAVARGPHKSARSPEALEHFAQECKVKVASGQAKIVLWDTIKDDPPPQLKISPIAAIPHKSKAFWSILDLSFSL